MKIKTRLKKYPKIAWKNLNTSLVMNAIAGDMAASIQKRIRGSKVTPPLKSKTIARKKQFATVPLMETGLLVKSIRNRLSTKKNSAEVYIEDRKYKQSNKRQKTGRAKRSGKFSHLVTTNEIAVIHTEGLGKGLPKRKFFYATQEDYDKSCKLRIRQGLDGAMKRLGAIK